MKKTILSAQLIAKAIKMNDVDRLLIVCEKEIPNLGPLRMMLFIICRIFWKVSDGAKG